MAAYFCHMRHVRHLNGLVHRSEPIKGLLRKRGLHSSCSRGTVLVSRCRPGLRQRGVDHLNTSHLLLQRVVVCGVLPARWNSTVAPSIATDATDALSQDLPAGYIPELPPIPVPEMPIELPLNALGEPTLVSLGLAHWTPPGFIQWALESMHVGLDLPWWGAIMAGTIVLRICVFPLVVLAQRNAASMHNHMPTIQRLQDKFSKTRKGGNILEAARVASELQDYMKRNKVRPMRNLLVPLAQMPIFISVFIGIRTMANLPVDSMKTGGLMWFTDLTIPDPYYLLPVITMSTLLLTLELGVDGVRAQSMGHSIKWAMRIMPVILLPMILNFPSALLCYWVSTNGFSLVQVMIMKVPAIREFFNIPPLMIHPESAKPRKRGFVEGFRETWSNSKVMAEVEDRQRTDAMRWKEAGDGPLVKTFKHDPTKMALRAKSK